MSAKWLLNVAARAAVVALSTSSALAQISIPTVPVGNPGNTGETTINGTFGGVAYTYNVATTEVTNAQYAAFLNAVAATDTNALYNINMAGALGGITRSGSSGSYTYAPVPGRASNPVNNVSFWDAARFANWLHNGQPTGAQSNSTTENGAYTLTPGGITANTVTRNSNWQWAVASADEWYKAAYFQPASQGGDADNYWLYPTSSNTAPTASQANYLPANINDTTPVASYAPNWAGVYDMAGNVYEWNDSILAFARGPIVGGAFDNIAGWLTPLNAYAPAPFFERDQVGFRVVSIPGPSSIALLAIGGLVTARRRR
jgi:formylglycine-generating enzyme required for sulfatase activity